MLIEAQAMVGDGVSGPPVDDPGWPLQEAAAPSRAAELPDDAMLRPGAASAELPYMPRGAPLPPIPHWLDTADPPPAAVPPGADALLNELAEGIARATSQGALDLAPGAEDWGGTVPAANMPEPPSENILLRLPGEEAWLSEEVHSDSSCPPDGSFDIAAWGPGDGDAASAITARRSTLARDIDAADEEGALALARLYVSIGFGAEARATLQLMAPRHPDAPLLTAMSRIVDGEPVAPGVFDELGDCAGRAQLWVTLASGNLIKKDEVIVAFSELPLDLRRHLAPRLIEVLLQGEEEATAETIRAAVERAAGPHGPAFELAAARLDVEREEASGLQSMRDIAAATSPSSDDALALLLEVAHQKDEPVDPASITRAATRAQDLHGTVMGGRLLNGLIRAHLRRGEFDEAALRLGSGEVEPEQAALLAEEFFGALAKRGPDDAVLVHGAGFRSTFAQQLRDTPAGLAISSRLLDLGLPDLARSYMPEIPRNPAALLQAARLHFLSGNPDEALDFLARVPTPTPDHLRLRADVLSALGQQAQAQAIRQELDGADASGEVAAGPSTASAVAEPQGPTSSPRQIVVATEEARRRIDELLAAAPRP
jgi:hypothetical protein